MRGIIKRNHVRISIWLPKDSDHVNVPQAKKTLSTASPFQPTYMELTILQGSSFVGFSSVSSQLASCTLAETLGPSQQKAQFASNPDQNFLQVLTSVQYCVGFQNFVAAILIAKGHNLLKEVMFKGHEKIHHKSCIK